MKILTEGVIVFASSKGLSEEFQEKEFDYEFPKGIEKLLKENIIIAFKTNDGNSLIVDFKENEVCTEMKFNWEIEQFITLKDQDDLLILSHPEFTQICRKKGDYRNYSWPINKIEKLESGNYKMKFRIENIMDRFEEYNAYFRLTVSLNKVDELSVENRIIEISA